METIATVENSTEYSYHSSRIGSSRRSRRTRVEAGLSRDPYSSTLTHRLRGPSPTKRRTTTEIFNYQSHETPAVEEDTTTQVPETTSNDKFKKQDESIGRLLWSILGAIGVVYGDLITSPIYTPNSVYEYAIKEKRLPSRKEVIGYTSSTCWLLIIIVCMKYCYFVMFADYNGEGGSFAIYENIKRFKLTKWAGIILTVLACASAALLSGDCIITPAISVLAALEGVTLVQPSFKDYIIGVSIVILFLLYFVQSYGTKLLGRCFGPILLTWTCILMGVGIWNVTLDSSILKALSPFEVIRFWFIEGNGRFIDLSNIVLCVTGCEAMFVDMGHFGRKPILYAWLFLLFPAALIQYLGQGAFLLSCLKKFSANEAERISILNEMATSIFWVTIPRSSMFLYYFILIIASLSTIAASQAVISGAFTVMAQASQLQFLPRLHIVYTNPEEKGQVYVSVIAVVDAVVAIILVCVYQHSVKLAAAFGVAVSSVFCITTFLVFYYVAPNCWKYSRYFSISLLIFFITLEFLLWASTITKLVQGGWITILVASIASLIMAIWTNVTSRTKVMVQQLKEKEALLLGSSNVSNPRDMMVPSNNMDIPSTNKEIHDSIRDKTENFHSETGDNAPVDYRYLSSTRDAGRCKGLGIFLTRTSVIETQVRDHSCTTEKEDFQVGSASMTNQCSQSSKVAPFAPIGLSRIVSRFKVLPEYVLLVTVEICSTPFIDDNERIMTQVIDDNSKGILCAAKLLVGWAEPIDSADVLESLIFVANKNKGSFPLPIEERLLRIVSEDQLLSFENSKTGFNASQNSATDNNETRTSLVSHPQSYAIQLADGTIEPLSIFISRKLVQPCINASRFIRFLVSSYNALKDVLEIDATNYLNLPPDNTTEVGIAVTLQ